MKIAKIIELHDGDVLEQDVMTNNYQILLGKGTILKGDYINKLNELGITEVCIQDAQLMNAEQIMILRTDIQECYKNKIKEILEKHTYQHNEELEELSKTADIIITEIINEDKVIEKVYDIKERSADIYEHSISMCTLAIIMALKYCLPGDIIHDIGVASLLHDLGLRYLTIEYENQNMTDMSYFEQTEYKKHPVYAYTALRNENWISDKCKNMILMHHEHIDGSGYPLHATNIPIEVQIIAICDVFDEMISGIGCVRSKVYESVEYLKAARDHFYRADIVDTFLRFTAVYPAGTHVLTNEGETAIVIRQNRDFPDRPVLQVILDLDGNNVEEEMIKDMEKELTLFIEAVID